MIVFVNNGILYNNVLVYSAINIGSNNSMIAYNSVSNGNNNIVLYDSSAMINDTEYGPLNITTRNILLYNSKDKARNASESVSASGYYTQGSNQFTKYFTLQTEHYCNMLMYDSTINVNSTDSCLLLYGSKTSAFMQNTILAYNSTNTGTNSYVYNTYVSKYYSNDHTKQSIAMYDSSLNDEAETIKLWNNKIVIKPYGFVNGVAIYDNAKIGSIAADTNINHYISANQTAVAVFI